MHQTWRSSKLADFTVPRDTPKCANCHGGHAASYKGCIKYQDKITANRPSTVRDLSETLTTVKQIVTDAAVLAKTARCTDFDPDKALQQCKNRQDLHFTNLLRKLLKVPPDSSKQDSPDPSAEWDKPLPPTTKTTVTETTNAKERLMRAGNPQLKKLLPRLLASPGKPTQLNSTQPLVNGWTFSVKSSYSRKIFDNINCY